MFLKLEKKKISTYFYNNNIENALRMPEYSIYTIKLQLHTCQ